VCKEPLIGAMVCPTAVGLWVNHLTSLVSISLSCSTGV
jgi:hypothetical protein